MAQSRKLKVMFLSEKSILDFNSGAALELRTWFNYLTKAGHSCSSFSFSCFDGKQEYPVKTLVSGQIDLERDHGRLCNLVVDGIDHTLLLTKSTQTENLVDNDIITFNRKAKEHIDKLRPDVIVCFGSPYLAPILRHARAGGTKSMFYLASGAYDEKGRPQLEAVDRVVVPTEAMRKLYKERLGLKNMQIMPVSPNHSASRSAEELPQLAATRREKFITMINPAAPKGGLVFINLANRFTEIDRKLTFLAVESRGTQTMWQDAGIETTAIKNLWWLPKQADITHVFRKTSLLIVPSVGYEAAGKVIPEALVMGIPVIGSNMGGIPDTMAGSGEIVPVPEDVVKNNVVMPPAFIDQWVIAVKKIMDDEATYLRYAEKSLKAGQAYMPQRIAHQVVKMFEDMV